ncbi:MAG: galactokinase [Treponema sp.]|nr:galactokinase [Treponema sp.]
MTNSTIDFDVKNLLDEFNKLYGTSAHHVRVFSAPARINIIGEHIDYNGGKVFPAAINKYLYIAMRKRNDAAITYNDLKFPGTFSYTIHDAFSYKKENDYANYLNGILSILKRRGFSLSCGFDVLIASNIPSAGGISSSSALECCFAYAVSETFNFAVARKDIALIGQQSEHEFMNVHCGIMDQFIIATAKEHTAELLDCATLSYEYVPLQLGNYRFVVMDTKKQRRLADSKYNERRSECELGLELLKKAAIPLPSGTYTNTKDIPNLCSLSVQQFDACKDAIKDAIICRRVKHCVTENERVLETVSALKAGNLQQLGMLLKEAHNSVRDDYEATGIELDTLVESAIMQDGCIGARMTGAGFGGCAIALVHNDSIEKFINAVQKIYTNAIGHDAGFISCTTSDGVREITHTFH